MLNKLIYKSEIDRSFCKETKEFSLINSDIDIVIRSESELSEENPAAFYYDDPYYLFIIELIDRKKERTFNTFKVEAERILISFIKWLNDIQGIKATIPVFYKGYQNGSQVNSQGQAILGSAGITIYTLPFEKGVSNDELEDIFHELDNSQGELEYLKNTEKLFEKRRQIYFSKNIIGNFVGLYAYLQEITNASKQKELDEYIRQKTSYNSKYDKKTSKPNQDYDETIFTWLRNQIGHLNIKTTNYEEISEEINEWIEELYEITLTALKDYNEKDD